MQRLLATLVTLATSLVVACSASAQLSAPNAAGVAMGHLHYVVRDVTANKAFWVALGGTPIRSGAATEGVCARLRRATNLGFTIDGGGSDEFAARHNRKIDVPIIAHHIHLNVPEDQVAAAKSWYAKYFGGVGGKRWRYEAVDLPGININISGVPAAQAPTRGRMLDHIGFEVRDLAAFCKRLEAAGIEFDRPYSQLPSGFALAFLTDPWGTYIELTESLRAL